ncbi:MAG: hypothetical protein Q7T81_05340 [Pseudolabrys sp.]|nr:hypothetical protein [Pseudolabrys sp.]
MTDKGRFAPINRNFCNFPMARDARLEIDWRRSEKTGVWLLDLPGDRSLQYRLPEHTPKRLLRWPTAFDVNVLVLLLSEAKRRDSNEIQFPSYAAALKMLDYSVTPRHRQKLKNSLHLWSMLMIWFEKWYVPVKSRYIDNDTGEVFSDYRKGRRKDYSINQIGKREKKLLSPPIETLDTGEGRIRISITDEWREFGQRYFAQAPLPLPRDAVAQNLALAVLTTYSERDGGDVWHRQIRPLCRKIGLNHHNRAARLRLALDAVSDWFDEHGGQFLWHWPRGDNKINLAVLKNMKVSKPKAKRSLRRVRIELNDHAEASSRDDVGQHHERLAKRLFSPDDRENRREELRELLEERRFVEMMAARGTEFQNTEDAEMAFQNWRRWHGSVMGVRKSLAEAGE